MSCVIYVVIGSAMSSNIGKLMVDMLIESAQWIEVLVLLVYV